MAAEAEVGSGLAAGEKQRTVVVVAVDDSDHSYHALEWTVRHVAAPGGGVAGGAADLVIVHAKPSPSSIVSFGGPGAGEAIRHVDAGLRKTAEAVVARARRVCAAASSARALVEVVEVEPRTVLCSAAEKHRADLLVLGSHGYGAVKRALLGSVSDYCAHHAPCSVMIVKQPTKSK